MVSGRKIFRDGSICARQQNKLFFNWPLRNITHRIGLGTMRCTMREQTVLAGLRYQSIFRQADGLALVSALNCMSLKLGASLVSN